jgi:hypothetical protein
MPFRRWPGIATVLFLVSSSSLADRELQRAVLRGLRSYEVLVDVLETEIPNGRGMSQEEVRNIVEVALRRAGLRVTPPSSALTPYVYVLVEAIRREQTGLAACFVLLEVRARARLNHNHVLKMVPIWSDSRLLTVGVNNYVGAVREDLAVLLDRLVNDQLAANER